MNVIRNRIERALALTREISVRRQFSETKRRRGSYQNGVHRFPHHMTTTMSDELLTRLNAFCAAHRVERSVIVRDALEVWLGIAETELAEQSVATVVRRVRS